LVTAAATPAPAPVKSQVVAAPEPLKSVAPVVLAPKPAEAKPAAPKPLESKPLDSKPVESKPAAPELAGAFKPAFSPGGKYVVQIAAPSTEAAALSEWDKRAKALPELFSTAERV